ncbi:uncharacterized protein PITG_22318 [Phytophthora infestans T30-4]|uniref:Secreted RxLR effector peptide protein n=1 Tax=Phytophthora infestans (strain T30-4) TaxID=403677 RepID=D0RM51_PHYIT|nr:uncharacterized protein PITG_22318 [Phytophthora infestans T30-4]EEY59287.1 conserved hypothetical protein [Phytophthora infestans T30-4]|eukprot:XP_002909879.1 conserved hypothetical protein [Phytophthora infestans T30-4]
MLSVSILKTEYPLFNALAVASLLLLLVEAAQPPWTLPVLHITFRVLTGTDIHKWITKNCERFEGRLFTVKVLGLPEMLVFMNFPKGPHYIEDMKDLLGDGIFAVDGVKWAHQRDVACGLTCVLRIAPWTCIN